MKVKITLPKTPAIHSSWCLAGSGALVDKNGWGLGPLIHFLHLYTNTVLDRSVILSMILSVCPFAIETTFPLSNFKTKHIFGDLMERVMIVKPLGRRRHPNFFFAAEGSVS